MMLSACHDLNLNPLSSGSTGNWYSTENEVEMAVNELYKYEFWPEDGQQQGDWSDDYICRSTLTDFDNGTLNGQMPGSPDYGMDSIRLLHEPIMSSIKLIVPSTTELLPRLSIV